MINGNIFVLGITGRARAGKDTLAQFVEKHLELLGMAWNNIYRISLASPIKEMAYDLIVPFVDDGDDCIYGGSKEEVIPELGKSPREIMQSLGTDWGREFFGDDIWIKHLVASAKVAFEGEEGRLCVLIVPDVRFDNEARMCDMVVRVVRASAPDVAEHVSEAGVDDSLVYEIIDNSGSENDLDLTAKRLTNRILFNAEEKYHGRT